MLLQKNDSEASPGACVTCKERECVCLSALHVAVRQSVLMCVCVRV